MLPRHPVLAPLCTCVALALASVAAVGCGGAERTNSAAAAVPAGLAGGTAPAAPPSGEPAGGDATGTTAPQGTSVPLPTQTFTTLAPVDRPRIAVVGDSLTHTATPELLWQLRFAGWDVVTIDGTLGAPIADRVPVVQQLVATGELDAIVFALGSNDARLNVDTGRDVGEAWRVTQSAAFTALAEAQVVPCVVWVGVNANAPTWKLDQWGAWFNAWLRYYTHYADWTAASADHPEYFLADDVHLSLTGNRAYAELMVATVADACLPAAP
ncbi:MAG: hypothetical protein R2690_08315 [Acidimicrobiales bacterium]